jgi:hypothetical protein
MRRPQGERATQYASVAVARIRPTEGKGRAALAFIGSKILVGLLPPSACSTDIIRSRVEIRVSK